MQAENQPVNANEPFSFVGMRLTEVIERFGTPKTVFASRGGEIWQDDVVFQYNEGDFYIYKDRVWQVKISSACGISLGDTKPIAMLLFGDKAENRGSYLLQQLPSGNWPLMLRVNFDSTGLVSAIYIYRPDL